MRLYESANSGTETFYPSKRILTNLADWYRSTIYGCGQGFW